MEHLTEAQNQFGNITLTVGGLIAIIGLAFGVAKFLNWIEERMKELLKPLIKQDESLGLEIAGMKAQATIDRDAQRNSEKEALKTFVRGEDLHRLEENMRGAFDDLKSDIRHLREAFDHQHQGVRK